MIRLTISPEDRITLENIRRHASSRDSEKILMVLLNNEGLSPTRISKKLKRHPHTVRECLKRFRKEGVKGLDRKYSPGRPQEKREKVKQVVLEILSKEPTAYGYKEYVWNVSLISHYLEEIHNIKVSDDTIERALKDCGFTYKRPSSAVSCKAPDKEEKKAAIEKMVKEIKEILSRGDCEIFSLDESHFSTEPYITRGWIKKRWPPEDFWPGKTRKSHMLWCIESGNTKILLEKVT